MTAARLLTLLLLGADLESEANRAIEQERQHVQVAAISEDVYAPELLPIDVVGDFEFDSLSSHGERDDALRLPNDYEKPRPLTFGQGFLDAGPIPLYPRLRWMGGGNSLTPALTAYGAYSLFTAVFEENHQERVGIGHQLLIDVDLSLGASERIHAQWRPLGGKNSGGSFLQLNEDVRYFDNATGVPQRVWFEGSLAEIFSGFVSDSRRADFFLTAGLFPMQLQNRLLINDDLVGVALSKNTLICGPLSNLFIQAFGAFDEIDAFENEDDIRMFGLHSSLDWHGRFIETTYAHLFDVTDASRDQDFLATSLTIFSGRQTLTGRALFNFGDVGRDGSGQLFVLECNRVREFGRRYFGVDEVVSYATAFWATDGWNSISGGSFDRLRSTFAANPLVRLSIVPTGTETRGITFGCELFARHRDLALIPEVAAEFPGDDEVIRLGVRVRQKLGKRSQIDLLGLSSLTGTDSLRRHGIFIELLTFF